MGLQLERLALHVPSGLPSKKGDAQMTVEQLTQEITPQGRGAPAIITASDRCGL